MLLLGGSCLRQWRLVQPLAALFESGGRIHLIQQVGSTVLIAHYDREGRPQGTHEVKVPLPAGTEFIAHTAVQAG